MIRLVFSIFIWVTLSHFSSAQTTVDSVKNAYNTQTILLNNGIRINNQLVGKPELSQLMKRFEYSDKYYQQYLKARKPAVLLPLISFGAIIGGALVSRENNTAGIIMISSSSIFTISGAFFARKANNNLNLAIWHYNRDVLFSPK
ncbi:MAG: hypothetical protein K2X48_02430 [Chitinophagaceae bacterium]|nr:hypothetical protein [Chitinophagaceae bacterium]